MSNIRHTFHPSPKKLSKGNLEICGHIYMSGHIYESGHEKVKSIM